MDVELIIWTVRLSSKLLWWSLLDCSDTSTLVKGTIKAGEAGTDAVIRAAFRGIKQSIFKILYYSPTASVKKQQHRWVMQKSLMYWCQCTTILLEYNKNIVKHLKVSINTADISQITT